LRPDLLISAAGNGWAFFVEGD
jgi:hypothetical protein